MSIESIRNDPSWDGGNYATPPRAYLYTAPLLFLLAQGVEQLHRIAPDRLAADRHYEGLLKVMAAHDANDLLYVLESTEDFDASAGLEKTTAEVLAINFEGDEICRPDISEGDPAFQRLSNAKFVLVAANKDSCGHFTYFQPERWISHLVEFLDQRTLQDRR